VALALGSFLMGARISLLRARIERRRGRVGFGRARLRFMRTRLRVVRVSRRSAIAPQKADGHGRFRFRGRLAFHDAGLLALLIFPAETSS
jgi:hypothetical protein